MSKGLEKALADVNTKYGKGTILRASEAKSLIVDRVTTGIFDLDVKLGGGAPRGRILMLKGEFSAGKSTVAMLQAAHQQQCDRRTGKPFYELTLDGEVKKLNWGGKGEPDPMRVVWLDSEHSFDPDWAQKWGVDTDNCYVIQTEYAEQGIDVADAVIRSGECDLLVVDSIAALTPGVEVEQSSEKWQMGVMARLMNKALRKWTSGMNAGGLLAKTKCSITLINQMRLDISGKYARTTSPGGKGLDFFQSVEVRFKKVEWIEDPILKRNVGIEVEYVTIKNKCGPAMQTGKFKLFFVTSEHLGYKVGQVDTAAQIMRAAAYWGLLKKGGSWYTFPDGKKVQGENKAALKLRDEHELLVQYRTRILEKELAWMTEGKSEGVNIKASSDDDEEAEES